MFRDKPVFYEEQTNGKYRLYQYLSLAELPTDSQILTIAENVENVEDAKLIAKLLIQNMKQPEK